MAHSTLILERNGIKKMCPVGFSWTTFFFAFFVPLLRGDAVMTALMILTLILTIPLFSLPFYIWCFVYNKVYIKRLISDGYTFVDVYGQCSKEMVEMKIGVDFDKLGQNYSRNRTPSPSPSLPNENTGNKKARAKPAERNYKSSPGLTVDGRMKVSTLKKKFHAEFGLTLRLYEGSRFADENKTISKLRTKKGTSSALSVSRNMKVGNLENKFNKEFGLKVQVAGSDDSYLCNNNDTLISAQRKDNDKINQ